MCTELHTPHRLFTSRLGEAAGPWGWCDHGPGEGGRSEQNRSLVTGICPVPHPVPLVPSGRHESGGDPAGTLVPGLPHYPGLSPPSSPPGEALGLTPTPPLPGSALLPGAPPAASPCTRPGTQSRPACAHARCSSAAGPLCPSPVTPLPVLELALGAPFPFGRPNLPLPPPPHPGLARTAGICAVSTWAG